LRTRLLELEEQKIQFLRHVSHELKTPLTAVREGAELLAEEVLGPLNEHQAEVAHILQHNTLRLQKLIEDLLAFNRQPEARGLALARKDVPLDRVVNEVLADYKLALRTKRIRIEAALEPVTLAGDADKLRTIVDNLLSNAIKYSPRSGVIRLSLARQAEEVTLEVQDQGPGIREADRGQVFDAFFQGELQPSGPVKGTGLGLAIVRDCVLAHGGKITIVDGPESGAHLRVSLPTTSEDLET
jgi:two-component system sensor histidine kinase GlrK